MAEDTTTAVPIVDIGAFLSGDGSPDEVAALCAAVAEAFRYCSNTDSVLISEQIICRAWVSRRVRARC